VIVFFFQAEDGIRDFHVTGVQTCALPIYRAGDLHDEDRRGGGGGHGIGEAGFADPPDVIESPVVDGSQGGEVGRLLLCHSVQGQIGRASCRERVWIAGGGG